MDDCIFCKIIEGSIPSQRQFEDDRCICFNDIHPKDRIHLLIVPKKHIPTLDDVSQADEPLLGHLTNVGRRLAKANNCPGYRLQWNVGKAGGQEVFHIHLHLIGK